MINMSIFFQMLFLIKTISNKFGNADLTSNLKIHNYDK